MDAQRILHLARLAGLKLPKDGIEHWIKAIQQLDSLVRPITRIDTTAVTPLISISQDILQHQAKLPSTDIKPSSQREINTILGRKLLPYSSTHRDVFYIVEQDSMTNK